jgi:hypothetical protein
MFYSIVFRLEDGIQDSYVSQRKLNSIVNQKDLYKIYNEVWLHKNTNKDIYFHPKPLYVYQILQTEITLPHQTRQHHIYQGKGIITEQKAIDISSRRDLKITVNTVFEKPKYFLNCLTDDASYPNLTISRNLVQAFQCIKSKNGGWEAHNLGRVYASFAFNGSHFPGYVYTEVEWH